MKKMNILTSNEKNENFTSKKEINICMRKKEISIFISKLIILYQISCQTKKMYRFYYEISNLPQPKKKYFYVK